MSQYYSFEAVSTGGGGRKRSRFPLKPFLALLALVILAGGLFLALRHHRPAPRVEPAPLATLAPAAPTPAPATPVPTPEPISGGSSGYTPWRYYRTLLSSGE